MRRAVASNHAIDNLALEINSLKFAQNLTFSDCVHAIVPSLLGDLPLERRPKKEKVGLVKGCLKRWAPLLSRFVHSDAEQRAILEEATALCSRGGGSGEAWLEVFEHVLHGLYEAEVLSEPAVLRWADEAAAAADGSIERRLFRSAENFVT